MTYREPCWNNRAPNANGYWLQVRDYSMSLRGSYEIQNEFIPYTMTKECQQPGRGHDPLPGCAGCRELRTYD